MTEVRTIEIARLFELAEAEQLIPRLDEIFFESSSVSTFESEERRLAFRERWLGQFLRCDPDWVYVAGCGLGDTSARHVVGYLIASPDDPWASGRFSELSYFENFSEFTRMYPAQLHVNLAPEARGQGIGSSMVERVMSDLASRGIPGAHVVTGRGMRNAGFYLRNGFEELGAAPWKGGDVLFLARKTGCG